MYSASVSAALVLSLAAAASAAPISLEAREPLSLDESVKGVENIIALPISTADHVVNGRALNFGTIAKELGKGAATGGGLAALLAGAEALLGGGGDQAAAKRDIDERALSFGAIAKELGKGAATGGGLAALLAGASALLGGGDQAAKRDLDAREPLSLGSLVGATDDALSTVLKNGAIGGAAFGLSNGIADDFLGLFNKREITQEQLDALEEKLQELSHVGVQKRAAAGAAGAKVAEGLGSIISKGLLGGLGSALGGFGVNEIIGKLTERDFDGELVAREPLTLGPITKGLLGTGVGLGASTLVGSALDGIESLFQREAGLNELD